MNDWQLRVIDEREQLELRMDKLSVFAETDAFGALPPVEQLDLMLQLEHMVGYAKALRRRIARFT